MKNYLFILVFFQLFSGSIFCQYHFLETLDDVLIGPQNVDCFYPEQVEHYTKKYNTLTENIGEILVNQRGELKEMEAEKKKKRWNLNRINEKKQIIENSEIDQEIIEDFILLWSGLILGTREKDFAKVYDGSLCYSFFANYKNISSQECRIELDERALIEWEEFMRQEDFEEKEHLQIVKAAGTKWIKKRADKNCLSNDPNDCMVWCLVEIPVEYQLTNSNEEVLDNFQLSEKRNVFYREFSIENSKEKKYRIFTLRDNRELNILDFKEIKCD